mmetsp:Transcript_9047/g.27681  ORF Transcript_9047/g.27681 Transcript_9047/m.27681 type:complete len:275 (+) Transcript_9047:914-1738(+)
MLLKIQSWGSCEFGSGAVDHSKCSDEASFHNKAAWLAPRSAGTAKLTQASAAATARHISNARFLRKESVFGFGLIGAPICATRNSCAIKPSRSSGVIDVCLSVPSITWHLVPWPKIQALIRFANAVCLLTKTPPSHPQSTPRGSDNRTKKKLSVNGSATSSWRKGGTKFTMGPLMTNGITLSTKLPTTEARMQDQYVTMLKADSGAISNANSTPLAGTAKTEMAPMATETIISCSAYSGTCRIPRNQGSRTNLRMMTAAQCTKGPSLPIGRLAA